MARIPWSIMCCLLAASACVARGDAVDPSSSVVCTATLEYVSQNLYRGNFLGGPSIEPTIDVTKGPWDLGCWENGTVSNRIYGPSSTWLDVYGSYTLEVPKTGVSLDPGFGVYYIPWGPGLYNRYHTSVEPNLGAAFAVGGVQFGPKVYDDVVLKVATYEMNAAYTVPWTGVHSEVDLSGSVGSSHTGSHVVAGVDQPATWSTYWQFGFAIPFAIGKSASLTLGWAYSGVSTRQPGAFAFGGHPVSSRGFYSISFDLKR
jgi:Bacterial protein of unknown function (Gcw_chp)